MIGVTRDNHVTTIELQRPDRRNALNTELVEGLRNAIETASAEDVRAIVLTGQGSVFCAGADLSGDAFAADYPDRLIALNLALDAAPMPVIGAINGPAIGAGLQLAMICDLRVVAPDAFFQFPTSKYGLALDNWSIRRLSSLVGYGRARSMLLTAEKLTADTALHTGMANRIGMLADAQAWAAEIAGLAPLALRHAKRVLNDDGAYEEQDTVHKELFDLAWGSQDVIEAQMARIEKRPPHFTGACPAMLRAALRMGVGTVTLLGGGFVLRALRGAPAALGAGPMEIREVADGSPNYRDGAFVNIDPASMVNFDRDGQGNLLREMLKGRTGRPPAAIPLGLPSGLGAPPVDLALNWFGHATALVEVDGYRILTDPVWSDRCSPSATIGPERMHEPPIALESLPAVDVVVISHDHYDHLDIETILALARTQRAPFAVPLGVGAHLRGWGIPEHRIIELDWGESGSVGDMILTCTPARHFSGRFLNRNTTLWASWVLAGPRHRVYFGGDTGYTTSFAEIGAEHGPFDVTLMPVGAYNTMWPDIHMNPEEAVRAHLDMNGPGRGILVPIHWCTFRLAPHPWAEPIERLLDAAAGADVAVAVPRPGDRVDPGAVSPLDPWWRM